MMNYRSKRTREEALPLQSSNSPQEKAPRVFSSQPDYEQSKVPASNSSQPLLSLENQYAHVHAHANSSQSQKKLPATPLPTYTQSSQPPKNLPEKPLSMGEGNRRWGPFCPPSTNNSQDVHSSSISGLRAPPPPPPSQSNNPIWKKPPTTPTSTTSTSEFKVASKSSSTTIPSSRPSKSVTIPPPRPLDSTTIPSSRPSKSARVPPSRPLESPTIPSSRPSKSATIPPSRPLESPIVSPLQNHSTVSQNSEQPPLHHTHQFTDSDGGSYRKAKKNSTQSNNGSHGKYCEWLAKVDEYDPKEDVLTIDANGKEQLVTGSIQPVDVWNSKGVKYVVHFNNLYQPIRKGGHILVRFLGTIAKQERFCPLSDKTWHDLEQYYKTSIWETIQEHFLIPNEEPYHTQALQRVDKVWRHYKWELKKDYYKPNEKTLKEMYDNPPNGVTKSNWVSLVNYWESGKGKQLSEFGQKARASRNQFHLCGGKSFANKRADYEDEHGEEMSLLQLWEDCYVRKDGTCLKGTDTEEFVEDVKAKVAILQSCESNGAKTRKEIEDEAVEAVLYGGEIPLRPQGYGFGVRKGDIYGARAALRKTSIKDGQKGMVEMDRVKAELSNLKQENKELHKQNEELKDKCDENTKLLKTVTSQFAQILDAVRSGNASMPNLDVLQSALHMAKSQGRVCIMLTSMPVSVYGSAVSVSLLVALLWLLF